MLANNLTTERLELRPIAIGDEQMLWPYVSDPNISQEMSWEAHKDISETKSFIESSIKSMEAGKSITWCIFLEKKFCGIFSLIAILRKHRALTYNRAELAYWLGGDFQKRGIMTEAGMKIIDFAFKDLKLHKLVVGHHINNLDSEKLIKRLGFDHMYTEEEVFMKNGNWVTCKFYELNSKNYLK
jgi:RimJ/RimL family protein N-acetyltransferase